MGNCINSPDKISGCQNLHIENTYTYDQIIETRDYILNQTGKFDAKIAIICGSGLGNIADIIKNPVYLPYKDLPHFPISTAPGHIGRLVIGSISSVPVICMQGRVHHFEGYTLRQCVMPIRLFKVLGISYLILSNAAGGLNPNLNVEDIMLIKDHFNIMGLAGNGCLMGPNDDHFGSRYFSMINCYDQSILEQIKSAFNSSEEELRSKIKEGVYTCLGGPNFETIAELRGLKSLGIDAVGMSTTHEVVSAVHCGIKCFAFSLITNKCPLEYGTNEEKTTSDDVLNVGKNNENNLQTFIEKVVVCIAANNVTI